MKAMSSVHPGMSLKQFEALPDDGYHHELSKGTLIREPPPGARHSRVVMNVARELEAFVGACNLGMVLLECGYVLDREAGTVRAPDISFIAHEHLPAELPVGFLGFAPDLAIEVLSPSNAASEIERKVIEYLDAGAAMVWVIDPETRSARSYRGNEAMLIREDDMLLGDAVLPGFELALSVVFA
jgi:Uma2 family endonuclease